MHDQISSDVTVNVSHRDLVRPSEDGAGITLRGQVALFTLMERNAAHVSDFFSLPTDQVIEIGRQIGNLSSVCIFKPALAVIIVPLFLK